MKQIRNITDIGFLYLGIHEPQVYIFILSEMIGKYRIFGDKNIILLSTMLIDRK